MRFVGNWIAAYFLSPEDFGVNFFVILLLMGLQLFSDVGIAPSVIRSERTYDQRFLNTAWTMQVLRGLFLYVCAVSLAVPWAEFYDSPVLIQLIPVAALTVIFDGFVSIRMITANRDLNLARVAILRIVSQGFAIIVIVSIAYLTGSVWSLVFGAVASSSMNLALSYFILKGPKNHFALERPAVKEIFTFGRWIFVSSAVTFIASRADGLILGKLLSQKDIGLYFIAFQVAQLPNSVVGQLAGKVLFPLYSRIGVANGQLKRKYMEYRVPFVVGSGWLLAMLIAVGAPIIVAIYPSEYSGVKTIIQLLSIGLWFSILEILTGSTLLAIGNPKAIATASLIKAILLFILIPFGFYLGGLIGSIGGMILAEVLRNVYVQLVVGKADYHVSASDYKYTLIFLVIAFFWLVL